MKMIEAKPYMDCNICGKPMYDGDKAYATVGGIIDRTVEGFYPSDNEPYYTIACDECGQKISDAISRLEVEIKAKR